MAASELLPIELHPRLSRRRGLRRLGVDAFLAPVGSLTAGRNNRRGFIAMGFEIGRAAGLARATGKAEDQERDDTDSSPQRR